MKPLWPSLFDRVESQPPAATEADVALLIESLGGPLSPAEARTFVESQRNPFPPGARPHANWLPASVNDWVFPPKLLPESYLGFLRWSNGPSVTRGAREIDFFSTFDLRDMMVGYAVPLNMPGAIPIANNGGGEWVLFDSRAGLVGGEYPVLCATSPGALSYESAGRIAESFEELCRGSVPLADVVRPPRSPSPESIDVVIARKPAGGLRSLSAALRDLGLAVPARQLRSYLDDLPRPLLERVPFYPYSRKVAAINERDPFLEIVENRRPNDERG